MIRWVVVLAVFFLGGISSYTTTVASRGPGGREEVLGQGPIRSILGGLSLIALLATIVWGFIHLTWYMVLLALVGVLVTNGIVYGGRQAFAFWYTAQPILDVLCIAGACVLWFLL